MDSVRITKYEKHIILRIYITKWYLKTKNH